MLTMIATDGFDVSATTAIRVPVLLALPTLGGVLKERAQQPEGVVLQVELPELRIPFHATIGVPVLTKIKGLDRHEWSLEMRAATNPSVYPTFHGVLALEPVGAHACELQLKGKYAVPLGPLGRAIDATLFRGAAVASLQRFVDDVAFRVAERVRASQVM